MRRAWSLRLEARARYKESKYNARINIATRAEGIVGLNFSRPVYRRRPQKNMHGREKCDIAVVCWGDSAPKYLLVVCMSACRCIDVVIFPASQFPQHAGPCGEEGRSFRPCRAAPFLLLIPFLASPAPDLSYHTCSTPSFLPSSFHNCYLQIALSLWARCSTGTT